MATSSEILVETIIILLLIAFNGLLAMSEMAIVSARKTKLQHLAASGSRGAKVALDLAGSPSDFLASVQVGITLIGIFAGAYGGATIAEKVAHYLDAYPPLAPYSRVISLGLVVMTVTILSLLGGELIPKRLALSNPERTATFVAPAIRLMAVIASPVVKILSALTDGALRILGTTTGHESAMTEEEVKIVIKQGTESGLFEKEEESMIKRVISYGDRLARELMTHRLKLVSLNLNAPTEENLEKINQSPHSYYPAYENSIDEFVGVIASKAVVSELARSRGGALDLRKCMIEPLRVAESMPALKLLDKFKRSSIHFALVIDEYGATVGLVTIVDVLEALVGELPKEREEAQVARRDDGSYLVDGLASIYELNEFYDLPIPIPEDEEDGDYETLAGFVMEKLDAIPKEGNHFDWAGFRFEVVDMDGHRIDKVLISRLDFTT